MFHRWNFVIGPAVAVALLGAAPTVAAQSPERPRVFLDTTYVAPTGRQTSVPAGGDLQGALDAAQPGDAIVLQAGATYTGNFTLPAKSGSGWIHVRSSALLQPARGGHPRGPCAGRPDAEDRQPQHGTGDRHGGRRPPLPVRRRRDHHDMGIDERHQLRPGLAGSAERQHHARPGADRHRVRSLLHPRHPDR